MKHKWIQRRKCGILTSSGWATIWATKKNKFCTLLQSSGLLWIVFATPCLQDLKLQASSFGFPAHGYTSPITLAWSRSVLALLFCLKTHLLPSINLHYARQFTAFEEEEMAWERGEGREEREEGKWKWLCIFPQFRFLHFIIYQMHLKFKSNSFQSNLVLNANHTHHLLSHQVTSLYFSNINQSNQLSHHSKWHDLTLDVTLDATSDLTLDLTCRTRILNTNALVKISGSGSLIPN